MAVRTYKITEYDINCGACVAHVQHENGSFVKIQHDDHELTLMLPDADTLYRHLGTILGKNGAA